MNEEQQRVIEAVKEGHNIFMFGAGGVGKSYCIQKVKEWCDLNNKKVAITATTGTASFLIQGTTIHSYLCIGVPGNKTPEQVANYVLKKRPDGVQRIRAAELLIIDEISMMDAALFDFIIAFLQIIRGPKGGLPQFLLSGDLYQLPPCDGEYVFKAESWKNIQVHELIHSHRHKDDALFAKILMELRVGICTPETLEILRQTSTKKIKHATYLFTKNIDVDAINQARLAKLNNVMCKQYRNINNNSSFAKQGRVPDRVDLCVGAVVMLTWNVDLERGLCNGAKGIVENTDNERVLVHFLNGLRVWISFIKVKSQDNKDEWVEFMPLRLAYAITINKSQGATLDRAIITFDDICSSYNSGRAYTALSRVRSLADISIRGDIQPHMFVPHPDVVKFLNVVKLKH